MSSEEIQPIKERIIIKWDFLRHLLSVYRCQHERTKKPLARNRKKSLETQRQVLQQQPCNTFIILFFSFLAALFPVLFPGGGYKNEWMMSSFFCVLRLWPFLFPIIIFFCHKQLTLLKNGPKKSWNSSRLQPSLF